MCENKADHDYFKLETTESSAGSNFGKGQNTSSKNSAVQSSGTHHQLNPETILFGIAILISEKATTNDCMEPSMLTNFRIFRDQSYRSGRDNVITTSKVERTTSKQRNELKEQLQNNIAKIDRTSSEQYSEFKEQLQKSKINSKNNFKRTQPVERKTSEQYIQLKRQLQSNIAERSAS
ncbi:hypothetical protein CHS0354_013366 [Potamilus streckersoni]|uniref:Uncharacterized protein n=1 Tax=Potamilus streckersoni TaxID=2493646 RepID=A0AAE0RVV6_9BIVA|nr:hypothetical protein CHS0354_013366 [Potamilus streckersoni]